MSANDYDVFLCHASEDKDDFVRPLADLLRELFLSVWYDEFEIDIGDDIVDKIDYGLAHSRAAVLTIIQPFIRKTWPSYEYRGLVHRRVKGNTLVLPIWRNISLDEVERVSPTLAQIKAVESPPVSIPSVALMVLRKVRPDIHAQLLRRLAFEKAAETPCPSSAQ